jgi:hypothetical protein
MLTPAEVRSAIAARVAAQVPTLKEAAEPYWLMRRGRSPVSKSFVVGLGKSETQGGRQAVSEGTRAKTVVKVLMALQAEAAAHLGAEDVIGELRQAVIVALLSEWSSEMAITWAEDPEVTADNSMVLFETLFVVVHQRPLE